MRWRSTCKISTNTKSFTNKKFSIVDVEEMKGERKYLLQNFFEALETSIVKESVRMEVTEIKRRNSGGMWRLQKGREGFLEVYVICV